MREPKDAIEAAYQSRILERARTLFTEQKYTSYQNGPTSPIWSVCKPDGTIYGVNLEAETCDCPGFQKDKICKHLVGLLLQLETEAADEAVCKQAEDREFGELVTQSDRYDREVRETGYNPY